MADLLPLDEDWQHGLAVVAHPDDLEYAAASAIARWTTGGKTISYLLVTRGQAGIDGMQPEKAGPARAEEERNSARVVGVNSVEFLDYPDGAVEYSLALRRDIARVIRNVRPEVLVSLNGDGWGGNRLNQADHRHVALAVIDAARDAGNRWIFPELLEGGLEPWSGAKRILMSGSPNPTHAVDVTNYLDRGIASLKEHKLYLEGLGTNADPAEFLTNFAESTGKQLGVRYAVAFEVFYL